MIQYEIDYSEALLLLLGIEENEREIVVSEEEIERHISSFSSSVQSMNLSEEIPITF